MMNAKTGRWLPLREHIAQSIKNILVTRIGTRVQREEYGSLLPDLIDAPLNEAALLRCSVAVVSALARWEPRYDVNHIQVRPVIDGSARVEIRLSGLINGLSEHFIVRF